MANGDNSAAQDHETLSHEQMFIIVQSAAFLLRVSMFPSLNKGTADTDSATKYNSGRSENNTESLSEDSLDEVFVVKDKFQ